MSWEISFRAKFICYTMFHIDKLWSSQQHWNTSKNNGSLLWLKMEIRNRYIDGSESIFYFHRVEEITRIGIFFTKLKKESSWIPSAPQFKTTLVVPKTSIQRYLNVIFPPLKCSLLKHLWYLVSLGEISNKTVRKTITENIFKQELGHKSYLLRDEESYIVETTEI